MLILQVETFCWSFGFLFDYPTFFFPMCCLGWSGLGPSPAGPKLALVGLGQLWPALAASGSGYFCSVSFSDLLCNLSLDSCFRFLVRIPCKVLFRLIFGLVVVNLVPNLASHFGASCRIPFRISFGFFWKFLVGFLFDSLLGSLLDPFFKLRF